MKKKLAILLKNIHDDILKAIQVAGMNQKMEKHLNFKAKYLKQKNKKESKRLEIKMIGNITKIYQNKWLQKNGEIKIKKIEIG